MEQDDPLYEHAEVTQRIIGCAMKVHSRLGPGFLEAVYQRALAHELTKWGMEVSCGHRITVFYDDVAVGEYIADLLVGSVVIVENKAVRALAPEHEVQLVNYLTATRLDVGLLLNFGAQRLQVRRKVRVLEPI